MLRLQQEQQRVSMERQRSANISAINEDLQNELVILNTKLAGEFHQFLICADIFRVLFEKHFLL